MLSNLLYLTYTHISQRSISMAFAGFLPEIPSSTSHCCSPCNGCRRHHQLSPHCLGALSETYRRSHIRYSRVMICCRRGADGSFFRSWRLNAIALRVIDGDADGKPSAPHTVEIPVSCYQIIGVPDDAEKDEIVKSVMDLKNAEIEEGYTMETVISTGSLDGCEG